MMIRYIFLVLGLVASTYCVAGNAAQKKHHYIKSEKIVIQLLSYKNNPENFLRFSRNRIDRNIRISIKLDVKDVKLIDITDVYADEERCDYHHSTKVSYL